MNLAGMSPLAMTVIGALAYLVATAGAAMHIHPRLRRHPWLWPAALIFAALALLLHAAVLKQSVFPAGGGLDLGFFNALLLIAWLLMALIMLVMPFRSVGNLLTLICPLSALILILQSRFHQPYLLRDALTAGMQMHITLSVLAYSLLTFATLQSLALHIQHHALRNKRLQRIYDILPPMQTMEKLLMQLILAGFFLLSLSLTSGLMFVHDILAQHLAHKTLLSVLAWCIYGILLCGRWWAGWRGITITKWTLGGFMLLALAYFGSKLVLELVLDRR